MRAAREAHEKVQHVLVNEGRLVQESGELIELRGGGQLAIEKKVCHFRERGMRGEILDGVPAVTQDAFFPVDECDRAPAGPGILVALVQRHVAAGLAEAADIDGLFSLGPPHDRQLVLPSLENELRGLGRPLPACDLRQRHVFPFRV